MQRANDIIGRITEIFLVMILSAMALAVFLQVIFRYLINLPLFWTEEFARYCLIWSSFLGAAVAMKRGEHIAVRIFMDRFPPAGRKALSAIALLCVIGILVIILWGGIKLVFVAQAQISPALRISMSIPYMAIPVGSGIMILHAVALFLKEIFELRLS
jgi:TRAP-type C4-dicarboxylate transport system permease small subunit